MTLIYFLILIFVSLLIYQFYLKYISLTTVVEGYEDKQTNNNNNSEYKPYNISDPNNSLILAQQNAGNIEVLKGRIDGLDGVKKRVDELQQNVDMMQTQIDGLVQQQADYAQELAGNQPIEVTGTGTETVEDVENSIEEEDKI